MSNYELRFPIGEYKAPNQISPSDVKAWIADIEQFPQNIKKETLHLSDSQLDTPYRPDGWTLRQVVHHCADSHINSFIRFKLALTEDKPTIKPYFEDRFAELIDSKTLPVSPSISILEGLHLRWITFLKKLDTDDLKRTFIHPEHGKEFFLDEYIGFYAWHCNHHLAHITMLKQKMGWE